jgi:hypothetical protein
VAATRETTRAEARETSGRTSTWRWSSTSLQTLLTKLVIYCTFLFVRENLEGFRDLENGMMSEVAPLGESSTNIPLETFSKLL